LDCGIARFDLCPGPGPDPIKIRAVFRNRDRALAALILVVSTGLRLWQPGLADVRFDEASGLQNALTVARGTFLAVATFSGSVAVHPPVYAYTMALPYVFTQHFEIVFAFRVLLDVAAIALTGWLTARHLGVRSALIAMLLFAVAPWAVQFARKTWLAPLPLYHAVLLLGLLEISGDQRRRGWWIAGVGFALSVGTHLSAIFLAPAVLVAAVLAWRRDHRSALRGLPGLIMPVALLATVYALHDVGTGWVNTRALLTASAGGEAGWSGQAVDFALMLSGGDRLGSLTSAAFAQWQGQPVAWLGFIDMVQVFIAALSVGLLVLALVRKHGIPVGVGLVLLTACAAPVLLQLRPSRPLQLHYLLTIYPTVFVILGWAISRVLANGPVAVRWPGRVALTIIVLWHGVSTIRLMNFVMAHDTAVGGYGDPIAAALQARDLTRQGQGEVIVVAPGGDPAVNEQAAVASVALAGQAVRFTPAEAGLILRGEPTQYVFTPGVADAGGLIAFTGASDRTRWRLPVRPSTDVDRAYTVVQVSRATLDPYQQAEARWANGTRLLGLRHTRDGERTRLTVLLSVEAIPAQNQHWFARAFVGDRQIAAQDTGGIHPSQWRVGDVLALTFELPSAEAPGAVRIGAYAYPEIVQTPVLDAAGNPTDDGVTAVLQSP
jgi:4-amino-4-deoxy-L-arabinose transferase-like glycosyltransferase